MATTQTIEFKDTAARAGSGPVGPGVSAPDTEGQGELMALNMGPSHPSTHGVLRLLVEMDGETITRAIPDLGYLHRGDEKIAENMTYNQFVPYTDRLDYLAPLANNVAYVLAVEKLMGIDGAVPPRGQYLRVICCELARISAHLLGLGAFAMDVGAMTVFLHTFTEREKIYNFCEWLTGARFTTSYTRIGGVTRDLPAGWAAKVEKFCDEVLATLDDVERLLTRNRIFVDRTRDVGVIPKAMAVDYGLTGPNLRGSGVDYDVRKSSPYLCYKDLEFDVPVGQVGDCYDRYLVRMEEMRQSVRILRHAPSAQDPRAILRQPGGAARRAPGTHDVRRRLDPGFHRLRHGRGRPLAPHDELHRTRSTGGAAGRAGHALPAEAQRFPDVPARPAGALRARVARGRRVDGVQAGPAAHQRSRVGDVLPDVPAGTPRAHARQGVPNPELRLGGIGGPSPPLRRATGIGRIQARAADDAGRRVHGGVCRVPRQLRHGSRGHGERRLGGEVHGVGLRPNCFGGAWQGRCPVIPWVGRHAKCAGYSVTASRESVGNFWGRLSRFANLAEGWLPDMDLNHDKQIQSLLCYRYTIGQLVGA